MEHFHQPYSEIKKMSMRDVNFLMALYETQAEYEKQEAEKMSRDVKKKSRFRRFK